MIRRILAYLRRLFSRPSPVVWINDKPWEDLDHELMRGYLENTTAPRRLA